jgi:hypothetical protein
VKRVHHGIPPLLLLCVARRQKHQDLAIDGIAFEIVLPRRAVNRDSLQSYGLSPWDSGRQIGFDLSAVGDYIAKNGATSRRSMM